MRLNYDLRATNRRRGEIAVRSQITNIFSIKYGTFGYLDSRNFPNMTALNHKDFLARLKIEVSRSREMFVSHFFRKYGDMHRDLPLWMAVELIPFGMTLTLFRALDDDIKKEIALSYGVLDPVMESWLTALTATRNISAHHGRLWNRELGYKLIYPGPTSVFPLESSISLLKPAVSLQHIFPKSIFDEFIQEKLIVETIMIMNNA